MDRLRHSKAAVVAALAVTAILIIATIVGLVEIVIPTTVSTFHVVINYMATTGANISYWMRIHPNWQFPIVLGTTVIVIGLVQLLAKVFHINWAKKFMKDFFD